MGGTSQNRYQNTRSSPSKSGAGLACSNLVDGRTMPCISQSPTFSCSVDHSARIQGRGKCVSLKGQTGHSLCNDDGARTLTFTHSELRVMLLVDFVPSTQCRLSPHIRKRT